MKDRRVSASPAVRLLLFASCVALVIGSGAFGPGYTQSQGERKIKIHTYNRMPVAIKEIRNLQKEGNWLRDLEIEVKNISRQPIYFISLSLGFPAVPASPPEPRPDGSIASRSETGFGISYGPDRMTDMTELPGPDDVPLKPGETYVLKVPEAYVMGYESMNRTMKIPPEAWNRIELSVSSINFGDGTGFVGSSRRLGNKKKE